MEAIGLILTALATGACAALKDTSEQAVKDAHQALKRLIGRKLEGNKAELALERYETEPEIWRLPLQDELIQAGADQDEQVVRAAEALMALFDARGPQVGKYKVEISGPAQGTVVGDHAQVNQSFGSRSTEP
jgi:hypothetical protein